MARPKRLQLDGSGNHRTRFPIEQEVRYQCLKRSRIVANGMGKTLDISSSDVRFTTGDTLQPGERVQVSVDWPALLHDTCLMKLVITGRVTRSEPSAATVAIEQYEFRTRGSAAAA
jgi:hypothetical protein